MKLGCDKVRLERVTGPAKQLERKPAEPKLSKKSSLNC